jgi:hypothetical protein
MKKREIQIKSTCSSIDINTDLIDWQIYKSKNEYNISSKASILFS